MNRQTSKVQKSKNSTLLPPTDFLQRKTLHRTDFGTSTVDIRSPSGQQINIPDIPEAGFHFNHDFSKIPVRLNSPYPIQAKLKIGQPDDKYEQEADRVAEQVMRMPDPRLSSPVGDSSLANGTITRCGTIQRACASCSEEYEKAEDENRPVQPANLCPKCRTQARGLIQTKQITPLIQAKTTGSVTPEVTPAINSGIQSLQGGGQPLSRSERDFFEPRFGADFSKVRVHNDSRAANAARSVNARAFTHRHNVVFGAGEYPSDTLAKRKLLAHELTHVMQQGGGSEPAVTVHREVTSAEEDLGGPLTASEWSTIVNAQVAGRVQVAGSLRDRELTGEIEHDAPLLAADVFCNRHVFSSEFGSGDPILCLDDAVTAADPRVVRLSEHLAARLRQQEAELAGPLTEREWRQVRIWQRNGEVGIIRFTANTADNAALVARATYCSRRIGSRLFGTGDPLICVSSEVTAALPSVRELTRHVQARGPIVNTSIIPWTLPPAVRATGEAQHIDYDNPPPWAGGAHCTGAFTPGARSLGDCLRSHFGTRYGGYACRPNTANPAQTSVHGTGRAIDVYVPMHGGTADNAIGDPIANYLVRNATALGVQYIVWDETKWNGSFAGRKDAPYSGPNPHHDHLHVEVNVAASGATGPCPA